MECEKESEADAKDITIYRNSGRRKSSGCLSHVKASDSDDAPQLMHGRRISC